MLEVKFILLITIFLVPPAPQSPFFIYLEACCLLLFEKSENFVKYTFIYNTTLFFYTFASHFFHYFFVILPFL